MNFRNEFNVIERQQEERKRNIKVGDIVAVNTTFGTAYYMVYYVDNDTISYCGNVIPNIEQINVFDEGKELKFPRIAQPLRVIEDKEKDYITKYLRIRGYYFDTVAVCLKKIPITDKEQRDKLIKIITSFDYQLISTDSLEKIHDLLMEIDRTEIVR